LTTLFDNKFQKSSKTITSASLRLDSEYNSDIVTRYDNPAQHGLPVLIVSEKPGKKPHTQDTSLSGEGNHHDPAKVRTSLEKKKPNA
jgi:hypothetical protein